MVSAIVVPFVPIKICYVNVIVSVSFLICVVGAFSVLTFFVSECIRFIRLSRPVLLLSVHAAFDVFDVSFCSES